MSRGADIGEQLAGCTPLTWPLIGGRPVHRSVRKLLWVSFTKLLRATQCNWLVSDSVSWREYSSTVRMATCTHIICENPGFKKYHTRTTTVGDGMIFDRWVFISIVVLFLIQAGGHPAGTHFQWLTLVHPLPIVFTTYMYWRRCLNMLSLFGTIPCTGLPRKSSVQ